MDMRNRVYYAVNLNQNHGLSWWNSRYDQYGRVYSANLRKLKGAVRSLKCRELRCGTLTGRYFQMMVSCLKGEEVDLVAILGQLKWANYEKLDGTECV